MMKICVLTFLKELFKTLKELMEKDHSDSSDSDTPQPVKGGSMYEKTPDDDDDEKPQKSAQYSQSPTAL